MGKAFSNRFRVFLLSAVMVALLASCAGPGEDPPHDDDMYGSAKPPVETATEPPADDSGSAGPAAEDDPEIVKAFKAYKAVLEDDEEGIMFLQSKHPKGTFSSFDVYRMEKSIAFADIDGDGIPELFYSIIDMDPEDDFVMVDKATGKVFDWNPKILAYRFKDGAAEKLYDEHAPWFRVDYASSGFASTTENGFCVAGIDSWLCSHYYEYALCPGGLELLRHLWWGKEYDSTDILLFYYYAEEEAPPDGSMARKTLNGPRGQKTTASHLMSILPGCRR